MAQRWMPPQSLSLHLTLDSDFIRAPLWRDVNWQHQWCWWDLLKQLGVLQLKDTRGRILTSSVAFGKNFRTCLPHVVLDVVFTLRCDRYRSRVRCMKEKFRRCWGTRPSQCNAMQEVQFYFQHSSSRSINTGGLWGVGGALSVKRALKWSFKLAGTYLKGAPLPSICPTTVV